MPNTRDALVSQIGAKTETLGDFFAVMDSEIPYEGRFSAIRHDYVADPGPVVRHGGRMTA